MLSPPSPRYTFYQGGTLELFAGTFQPVDVGQQYVLKMTSLLVRGIQEFSIN